MQFLYLFAVSCHCLVLLLIVKSSGIHTLPVCVHKYFVCSLRTSRSLSPLFQMIRCGEKVQRNAHRNDRLFRSTLFSGLWYWHVLVKFLPIFHFTYAIIISYQTFYLFLFVFCCLHCVFCLKISMWFVEFSPSLPNDYENTVMQRSIHLLRAIIMCIEVKWGEYMYTRRDEGRDRARE